MSILIVFLLSIFIAMAYAVSNVLLECSVPSLMDLNFWAEFQMFLYYMTYEGLLVFSSVFLFFLIGCVALMVTDND